MNKFKVVFGKDEVEDIIAYNNIINYIQGNTTKKTVFFGSFEESWHTKVHSLIDIQTTRTVCIMSVLNGKIRRHPTNL